MATEIRPDDRALRLGRRERALAQMKAQDLDVLVLGRTANVRYVTGTPTLWTAGTSAFGPACMLVRSTGSIHLLSTWDEGIPEDIPRENLFGLTWNPMNTIEVLRRVEGTAGARRVGTDAMSPAFAQLLSEKELHALMDTFEQKEKALPLGDFEKMVTEVTAIEKAFGLANLAKFTPKVG